MLGRVFSKVPSAKSNKQPDEPVDLRVQIKNSAYQQLTIASSYSQNQKKTIYYIVRSSSCYKHARDSEYLRDIVLLHRPSRVLKQGYTMLTDAKDKQIRPAVRNFMLRKRYISS